MTTSKVKTAPVLVSKAQATRMFNFGTGSSLSGSVNQQQQQPQGGLFSSFARPANVASALPATPATGTMFSSQTSTGLTYPRETNFMDLPAEMRQNLEALEKAIQAHADAARPFSNRVDPSGKLQQIEEKLTLLEEKIAAYTCLHSQQHARATAVKKATSMHWRYAESVARTIEASRGKETPGGLASGGSQMHWQRAFAPTDPTSEHFEEVIGEMETQLTLTEGIAEALRKQIEPLLSNDAERDATEAIRLVLSHEGETLAALTRRYSHLQDEVEGMRKRFRTFCAKYRNDSRDPFASKFDYDTRNHVALAAPAASSLAPLLPSQPVASVSQQMPSSSTVLFGSAPSSTSQLLPSATTALAPMKPAGSFGGFSFGQRP